jgi:hypothetical protein
VRYTLPTKNKKYLYRQSIKINHINKFTYYYTHKLTFDQLLLHMEIYKSGIKMLCCPYRLMSKIKRVIPYWPKKNNNELFKKKIK